MSRYLPVLIGVLCASAMAQSRPCRTAYDCPPNPVGVHLLTQGAGGRDGEHMQWARYLVGRWGYAKNFFYNIDANTRGPAHSWVEYVERCYEMEMIPVVRLGGYMRDGKWVKPKADAPGDYRSLAAAVKRVVAGLPRSEKCPLYIEVWNEPNLADEWSGQPVAKEYADFFVQAAEAIRSIGDKRIRILNGALATSPEFAEELCKANPKYVHAFDIYAAHPYPHTHPPHINLHDGTAAPGSKLVIDSHLLELDVLRRYGRDNVKVMITETGYELGNHVYPAYPIIDEYNRADYMMRAFRDYYPKWKEIVAVMPFEFCSANWERFDWVYPDSGTNPDGSPTRPHYQYTVVAALAKTTDVTGAINGTLTAAGLDARLPGATVKLSGGRGEATSDPMGNFFLPRLEPGAYELAITREGFAPVKRRVEVRAGENTIVDVALEATARSTLQGVVRSGDTGQPLADVEISLKPGKFTVRTDAAGAYRIEGCPPVRYELTARGASLCPYVSQPIEAPAGGTVTHDFPMGGCVWEPASNMARNPSMEAGGAGGGRPEIALGFEYVRGPFSGRLAEGVAHTGRWSQAIDVRAEVSVLRQITFYNTVRADARYAAGVWVRLDKGSKDARAWISIEFLNNHGVVLGHVEGAERVTSDRDGWHWLGAEGVAPAGSERFGLNLHTQGAAGIAYFDDAFIRRVDAK